MSKKQSISGGFLTGDFESDAGYVRNVEAKARYAGLHKEIRLKRRQLAGARDKARVGDSVLVRQREESRVSMLEGQISNLEREADQLQRETLRDAWSDAELDRAADAAADYTIDAAIEAEFEALEALEEES